jgi:hypothetical protein
VIYLGPAPVAAVLPTVAEVRDEEIQRMAPSRSEALRRPRPLAWPELSTPRDLLNRLTSDVGLRVEDIQAIPHDLWPEADWPALGFAQRMSLILAGFDLTFQIGDDGRSLRLVPLPPTASVTRTYRPTTGQSEAIRSIVAAAGNSRWTASAGGISVDGPIEVHRAIQRVIDGQTVRRPSSRKTTGGETRYSLEIKNQPVGPVAKQLAAKLELRIEFDPRVEPKLEQRVSFSVRDATREGLLRALLAPAGLDFRIDGDLLQIQPASPEGE